MVNRVKLLGLLASVCLSIFAFNSAAHAQVQAGSGEPEVNAPQDENSIIVIGEKLRRAGGVISMNRLTGKMKCKVLHPSGIERIDAATCEIALRCAKQNKRSRELFRGCVDAGYDEFLKTYFDS